MFVTVLVAFDFQDILSRRNLGLVLLLLPSLFLVDLVTLGNTPEDPTQTVWFGVLFLGLFLATAVLLVLALVRAFRPAVGRWAPNLATPILIGLTVLLLASNTFLALMRHPDDAGIFSNVGGEHLLKTGTYPYGAPALRGGAAATYGPVMYLAHIPFQLVLSPIAARLDPDANAVLRRIVVSPYPEYMYDGPPFLATKLALLAFHYLGVAGLVFIGRKLAGPAVGWGLACLYVGSAYVHGLGGEDWLIGGMTYFSHIAPTALTILAFAALSRPWLAGALLGTAAGALYYPAFLFPLWLGYYVWRRKGWFKFAAGFLVVCVVILGSVLLMTQGSENESVLEVIYQSTVGHQEAQDAYGSSTFSFWGTHPRMAAFWQKPFIQDWFLFRPSFLIFTALVGASFFLVRGRTISQFAFLTAALILAVQLWKSHAGGTYVEWYYPFFLIGLLVQRRPNRDEHSPQSAGAV
jgi:hypothetical protein